MSFQHQINVQINAPKGVPIEHTTRAKRSMQREIKSLTDEYLSTGGKINHVAAQYAPSRPTAYAFD